MAATISGWLLLSWAMDEPPTPIARPWQQCEATS